MPARRFVLLALVAGGGVALVLTHPLALHPASTELDDGTLDCFQFTWNLWWVRTSLLDLHTNPFFTRHLFFPSGVSLLFHTLSASLGLASLPLQLLLPGGVVTAHNVLVIAAPALLVLTTGLLAREVTGDPWAALTAGLLAALTGAIAWFLPVIYLTSTYLVAAVLWAWWRLHCRRRRADVALVLALLLALVLASQEYAMMALALLLLDTAARLLAPRALGLPAPWLRGLVATWTLAALGLGALALIAARNPAAAPPIDQVLLGSGFVSGFFTPSGSARFPFWMVLYVGTAPILFVATTAWLAARRAVFWTLASVAMLLMACGPFVGLHHPLFAEGASVPPTLDGVPPGFVRGPYWLAYQLVPLLRVFRGVYRWVAVAEIALAVLAATGVAALRARLPHAGTRRLATAVILALAVGLGLRDVWHHRNRVIAATVPDAYAVLRDDPEPCAILELPTGLTQEVFANLASRYMLYQTVHRKYLLEGTVARLPPGAHALVSRQFTTFADLPWVKYVVIHRDLLDVAFPVARTQVAQVDAILAREGVLVVRHGPLEIHRLTTFLPASAMAQTSTR
jgi:hypothetical protein